MSHDNNVPRIRERVWIEKFDHSGPKPRLVETVAIEDGRLVSITPATPEAEDADVPREPHA